MKKLWQEFKKFISRGNVIDMAVGVVIASAFTAIVNAIVNNILMPNRYISSTCRFRRISNCFKS